MFLLQLLKMGTMQELLKSGLRLVKQHGILKEGRHRMTVTFTITGEDGREARADVQVEYNQAKLAKFPQILDMHSDGWTVDG